MGHGRPRSALSRRARRLLRVELRPPCHPRAGGPPIGSWLDRATLTSRAYRTDRLGPFCRDLAEFCRHGDGGAHEHRAPRPWRRRSRVVADGGTRSRGPGRSGPIVVWPATSTGARQTLVGFSTIRGPVRVRPVHPGFDTVPFGATGSPTPPAPTQRRGAARAGPRRSGRRGSAGRLAQRRPGSHRASTFCWWPTRFSLDSAALAPPSRATRGSRSRRVRGG